MRNIFLLIFIFTLIIPKSFFSERGTRAKTMRNHTQRSSHGSTSSSSSSYRPSSGSSSRSTQTPSSTYRPTGTASPTYQPPYPLEPAPAEVEWVPAGTPPAETCTSCTQNSAIAGSEGLFGMEALSREFVLNTLSVNSRVAFTSWDFDFSPAIQYQSKFFPTYELDLNFLGFEFSYLTTFPLQSTNLFREIPIIEQKGFLRNSLIESLSLNAYPLMFMKDPLMKNLLSVEFRKTTKSTTILASQNLYYFPAATSPGLTEQDSDLGTIFYDQKPAGTLLSYTIKERDWLFTLGFYALRVGFFDLSYSKPYQMDADIYENDRLIDQRVFLFEGQATGQGLMVGMQNLLFPTWDTGRFHFSPPDSIATGFFWGLKELGVYWGTGNIRLQNNIDLVEKYTAFYQDENGHEPSVSFLRKVFHPMIGYKFNRHFRLFFEYRYVSYSLTFEDRYQNDTYNYFLSHAINKDTIQQFAVNLTVGF